MATFFWLTVALGAGKYFIALQDDNIELIDTIYVHIFYSVILYYGVYIFRHWRVIRFLHKSAKIAQGGLGKLAP